MINPNDDGYEEAALFEMARRLYHVLEEHPLLSGMITDDHQVYVKRLLENATGVYVTKLAEPNYAIELGYDPIPSPGLGIDGKPA